MMHLLPVRPERVEGLVAGLRWARFDKLSANGIY